VYYIIRYRKKVVVMNLKNSFPEKTTKDISIITRQFYHHFCDVFLESLKSFSMSEKEVCNRYKFINPDLGNKFYDEGKPIIVIAGHFNNWEWGGIAAGTQLKHKPIGFYKPLSNDAIDKYLQKTRVKGRSLLASITKTSETFQVFRNEPAAFYMIADQRPSSLRFAYWMKFLNQDTPVLHGPEKYARIYNYPVFYADIQKVKRGYYEVEFILLNADPKNSKTGEISGKFMNILEEKITVHPQYYLWTHKRWKYTRPQESKGRSMKD
jgi:Kdo2-lipid IVA lauroyltransferase/acyltransferase